MFADSLSVLSIYYVAQGLGVSFLCKCHASRGGYQQQQGLVEIVSCGCFTGKTAKAYIITLAVVWVVNLK